MPDDINKMLAICCVYVRIKSRVTSLKLGASLLANTAALVCVEGSCWSWRDHMELYYRNPGTLL